MKGNKSSVVLALLSAAVMCSAASALTGCKSISLTKYSSPRITGRVVDESTHRPIAGALVHRIASNSSFRPMEAPKGGQLMMEPLPARTEADGTFIIESERNLTPFRSGWYSVSLSFRHPGYQEFVAYYTIADSTNSAGEPVVHTGDILLLTK